MIRSQKKSREYILNNYKSNIIINSQDPNGDTSMNILLLLNSKEYYDELKELGLKYNIEVRKMWNGLYFDNNLFKNNKLQDIILKNNECIKTREIINKLAVISIPPVLRKKDCDKIIKFLNLIGD